jgi:hypothetical protein
VRVTKPIDLNLLGRELAAAGVVVNGLHIRADPAGDELLGTDPAPPFDATELPLAAVPVVDAHDASGPQRTKAFEAAEDEERLRLVADRSSDDPAFAALAELALRGVSR